MILCGDIAKLYMYVLFFFFFNNLVSYQDPSERNDDYNHTSKASALRAQPTLHQCVVMGVGRVGGIRRELVKLT